MANRIGTVIFAVVGVRNASDEGFGFGSNHKDCLARSRYLPIKKAVHFINYNKLEVADDQQTSSQGSI